MPTRSPALLDAAGELDRKARPDRRHIARRATLATMVFAALRIDELCTLRWRDVDFGAGRLWIGDAKTDAGRRFVKLLLPLHDELATHKANSARTRPNDYVFATTTGARPSIGNMRTRVFNAAVKRANKTLEADDHTPLPEGLTPHKLRHT